MKYSVTQNKVELNCSLHNNPVTELDLGHGGDIDGLDVVLELGYLLAQLVNGDLLVLDHAHDLQQKWEEY